VVVVVVVVVVDHSELAATAARGSAMECAAILDAFRVVGGAETQLLEEAGPLVVRLVEMLSKMAR
jgi:hypothetical protein